MNDFGLSERFVFIYWAGHHDSSIGSMNVDGTDLQVDVPPLGDEQVAPDWQP